jgi:hypothetical protein
MKFFPFFVKNLKKFLNITIVSFQQFFEYFKSLYENSPITKKALEKLQITFIYFLYYFNFVDLFLLRSREYTYPNIFLEFLNLHLKILDIPFITFLCNTDNTYFLHLIITQIVMQRKQIIFTNHVKFHIILLTLIDCFDRILLEYLLFFTSRESIGTMPPKFSSYLYIILFSISLFSYFYSYICGILKKDPIFPAPFDIITKSASFWVRTKKNTNNKVEKKKVKSF